MPEFSGWDHNASNGEEVDSPCPICRLRPADTEEHILPRATSKLFEKFGPWAMEDGRELEYPEITMMVCGKCNSRMNRHIEQPGLEQAHKMITGVPPPETNLRGNRVKELARWTLKQLVLVSHAHLDAYVPELFFDWLNITGRPEPPEGLSMWIGLFDAEAANMGPAEAEALKPVFHPALEWGTALVIGNLYMLGLYGKTPRNWETANPAVDLGYVQRLECGRKAVLDWPRTTALNLGIRDAIAAAFPMFDRRPSPPGE